tara:strand:- start:326 stop:493 length:168 start_codon:yes stop_codon:yes gene_type:complete
MLELLLYTTLSCEQSSAIMLRIGKHKDLSEKIKIELVETVKESAPHCEWYWDAND